MRGAAAVVEAISIIGPRNISALARQTGLPIETVRYLLRKRFPRIGLQPKLYLDFRRIGLVTFLADLNFPSELAKHSRHLLSALAEHAYLTYFAEFADRSGYATMFALPVKRRSELEELVRMLISQHVLATAEYHLLTWSRRVSVDPAYFDLRRGGWRVDWVRLHDHPFVEPKLMVEPQAEPSVDTTDLLILKELQKDATVAMSRISRTLGLSRRVLQYHYQNHVSALTSDYYVNWSGNGASGPVAMMLQLRFHNLTGGELRQVRAALNRIPFLVWEGGNDAGFYVAWLGLPQTELLQSLNFLKPAIGDLARDFDLCILSWTNSMAYTLPHHLFDNDTGWQFRPDRLVAALSPLQPSLAKKRARRR